MATRSPGVRILGAHPWAEIQMGRKVCATRVGKSIASTNPSYTKARQRDAEILAKVGYFK